MSPIWRKSAGGIVLVLGLAAALNSCGRKLKSGTATLAEDPAVENRPQEQTPRGWFGHLGTGRSGRTGESLERSNWDEEPPLVWEQEIGTGAAGIVIAEGRVYTVGNSGGQDTVRCLSLDDGTEVWSISYSCPLDKRQFEGGPGASPELDVENGRLYVLSHQGELRCLATADGSEVWKQSLVEDLGGGRPRWGFAGAPLVTGGRLVIDAGGDAGTIALDAATGGELWKAGGGKAGYAAVVGYSHRGKDAAAVFNAAGLSGFALEDGAALFEQEWETDYDVNACTPLYHAGHFFICSGYGKGGGLISITGSAPELVYETRDAVSQFQSPVRIDDHVYLVTGDNSSRSRLVCLRFDNGDLQWSESVGGNRGNVIAIGDKLVVVTERGEAIVCDASPDGYEEDGRFQASGGRVWAAPAFADGRLLVRNNAGTLSVWDLR